MGSEATSPSLLSRVRNPGDHAAWREFDAKYGDLIVRFCRGRRLQHADAEDIRQMVMVKLARALRGFHYSPQRGQFRSYLSKVTRNEINRYFSRPNIAARPVDKGVEAGTFAVEDRDADAAWEREWVHHHLRLAMRCLRETYEPRSLEVFERLLAGEAAEHVATAFGMSTEAVHKVKQRIRDRMRGLVAAQMRDEEEPDEHAPEGRSTG